MSKRKVTFFIGANVKNFLKGMEKAQKKFQKVGKNLTRTGRSLSTGVTAPLLALNGIALAAWDKQAKAIAQVNAGLVSTGGTVGYTSKELQKMAADLQKNTLFGDEEILKGATSQLLTFTNITGEQFQRTQKAALDLATRLDGDLKSASIQLGKALNDPVSNLSALSRSGIQFSDSQKKVIKELAESGRLMDAQNIILDELNKQYGGSAEAAAKADSGLVQLKNTLGDVAESFGKIIQENMKPFIGKVKEVAEKINNLDTESKVKIIKFTVAIAAIGPAIIGVGVAIKGISLAIATLTSPITAIIAALAALSAGVAYVYENWNAIIERVSDIGWWKNAIINMVQFFVEHNPFAHILDGYNFLVEKFGGTPIPSPFDALSETLENLKTHTTEYEHEFKGFSESIISAFNKVKDNVNFGSIFGSSDTPSTPGTTSTSSPKEVTSLGRRRLQPETPTLNLPKVPEGTIPALDEVQSKYQAFSEELANNIAPVITSGLSDIAGSFIENAASAAVSGKGLGSVFKSVLISLADLAIRVGKIAIGVGFAIKGIKKALESLNPVAALAAGVALIAVGSIAKTALSNAAKPKGSRDIKVPALAKGGLSYAPTLAMVGDNPNAHIDPEVISPLSTLKRFFGTGNQQVIVPVYLDGREIAKANARLTNRYSR